MQDWYITSNSDGSNQTVDKLADCVSPLATGPVECRCCLIIYRFQRKGGRSGEKSAQLVKVLLVTGAREHFHANDVTRRDLGGE